MLTRLLLPLWLASERLGRWITDRHAEATERREQRHADEITANLRRLKERV